MHKMRKILYFVASICRLPFVSASPPLRLRFGFGFGFVLVLPLLLLFGFSISSCLRFGFWIFDFGLEYFEVAS